MKKKDPLKEELPEKDLPKKTTSGKYPWSEEKWANYPRVRKSESENAVKEMNEKALKSFHQRLSKIMRVIVETEEFIPNEAIADQSSSGDPAQATSSKDSNKHPHDQRGKRRHSEDVSLQGSKRNAGHQK